MIEARYSDAKVSLLEGGRGDFIVKLGDKILWDKKATEQGFPNGEEVLTRIQNYVEGA